MNKYIDINNYNINNTIFANPLIFVFDYDDTLVYHLDNNIFILPYLTNIFTLIKQKTGYPPIIFTAGSIISVTDLNNSKILRPYELCTDILSIKHNKIGIMEYNQNYDVCLFGLCPSNLIRNKYSNNNIRYINQLYSTINDLFSSYNTINIKNLDFLKIIISNSINKNVSNIKILFFDDLIDHVKNRRDYYDQFILMHNNIKSKLEIEWKFNEKLFIKIKKKNYTTGIISSNNNTILLYISLLLILTLKSKKFNRLSEYNTNRTRVFIEHLTNISNNNYMKSILPINVKKL